MKQKESLPELLQRAERVYPEISKVIRKLLETLLAVSENHHLVRSLIKGINTACNTARSINNGNLRKKENPPKIDP